MSRTYRKHAESFEEYYKFWLLDNPRYSFGFLINNEDDWVKDYLKTERYKYKTKSSKHYNYNLPKFYRNMVNRSRRTKDKQELWKAVNLIDHEEQCSKWNCKDNNAWGYW